MGPAVKTILSFGEILWDLLPSGPVLGGAPFNLAFRLHSLGDAALIASRVGADEPGLRALDRMKAAGMDTTYVQRDPGRPTGSAVVRVDELGFPEFSIPPDVAYDGIEARNELLAQAARADAVAFGTLAQRSPVSRETLRQLLGATRGLAFLDLNLREGCYTRETVTESLERADVLKLNEGEALQLAKWWGIRSGSLPELAREIMERWTLSHCLVTLAERGVLGLSARDAYYVPGYRVQVRDACGSGDAFSAGFLHLHLQGRSLLESLRWGNALGAVVATQDGATGGVDREDVFRLMGSGTERTRDERLLKWIVDGA